MKTNKPSYSSSVNRIGSNVRGKWRLYKSFIHDTWFDPEIPVFGRVVATSVVAFTMLVVFVVIGCILTSPIGFLAVSFAIFLAYFLARHIAQSSDKQARSIEPSEDDDLDA